MRTLLLLPLLTGCPYLFEPALAPFGDTGDTGMPDRVECYADADRDGFGTGPPILLDACPEGRTQRDGDCNDGDPAVFPGSPCTASVPCEGTGVCTNGTCLASPASCTCDQPCGAGACCTETCSGSCACPSGGACDFDCSTTSGCEQVDCAPGSSCILRGQTNNARNTSCDGSLCQIDCAGSANCDTTCTGGAVCDQRCDDRCGMTCDADSVCAMDCDDGVGNRRCNVDCRGSCLLDCSDAGNSCSMTCASGALQSCPAPFQDITVCDHPCPE